MAEENEDDDFKTDERGIFRDKLDSFSDSETDLRFDERGIMHDDAIMSFYHGGHDSGFCTAEHKSSSSLNFRINDESDGLDRRKEYDFYRDDEEEEDDVDEEDEEDPGENFGTEDQSYHISDHVVSRSDSIQASQDPLLSADGDQFNSVSRYPELIHGYFTSESEVSRPDGRRSRNADNVYADFSGADDPYYSSNDEEDNSLGNEKLLENQFLFLSGSSRGSGEDWQNIMNSNLKDQNSNFHWQKDSQVQMHSSDADKQLQRQENKLKINASGITDRKSKISDPNDRRLNASNVDHLLEEKLSESSLKEFEHIEATIESASNVSEDLISLDDRISSQFDELQSFADLEMSDGLIASERRTSQSSRLSDGSRGATDRVSKIPRKDTLARDKEQKRGKLGVPARTNLTDDQNTELILRKTSEQLSRLGKSDQESGAQHMRAVIPQHFLSPNQTGSRRSRSRSISPASLNSQNIRPLTQSNHGKSVVSNSNASSQHLRKVPPKNPNGKLIRENEKKEINVPPISPSSSSQLLEPGDKSDVRLMLSPDTSLRQSASAMESVDLSKRSVPNSGSNGDHDRHSSGPHSRVSRTNLNFSEVPTRKEVPATGKKGDHPTTKQPVRAKSLTLKAQSKVKRSSSVGSVVRAQQPLRAVPSIIKTSMPDSIGVIPGDGESDFRELFLTERHRQQIMQEEYRELHHSYTDLLQRHAEARNTLDSLRLRAEVRFSSNMPPPIQAQSGTMPPAQHAANFTMSKMATPSLSLIQQASSAGVNTGNSPIPQKALMSENSPGVINSHNADASQNQKLPKSGSENRGGLFDQRFGSNHRSEDRRTLDSNVQTMPSSESNEGSGLTENKMLSLLEKIGTLENEIGEFRSRLKSGIPTSDDEKTRFLRKVKEDYAEIEEIFDREFPKDDENRSIAERQNRKKMAYRLIQLHLAIQRLEDEMKVADEEGFSQTIFSSSEKQSDDAVDGPDESFRRASVVSLPGNCDQDETLSPDHNTAEYAELMDSYRRLKQVQSSPQRDDVVDKTLTELKKVYMQLPEHRKPPLPTELENSYNPMQESFVESELQPSKGADKNIHVIGSLQDSSPPSAETSSVMNESDLSSGSKQAPRRHPTLTLNHNLDAMNGSAASHGSGSTHLPGSSRRSSNSTREPVRDERKNREKRAKESAHERNRSGSRHLPLAARSQSEALREETRNRRLRALDAKSAALERSLRNSGERADSRKSRTDQNLKPEPKLIRTSARTPIDQLYSDTTDSSSTDSTVEERLKPQTKRSLGVESDSSDTSGFENRLGDEFVIPFHGFRVNENRRAKEEWSPSRNFPQVNNLLQPVFLHPSSSVYPHGVLYPGYPAPEPLVAQLPPGSMAPVHNADLNRPLHKDSYENPRGFQGHLRGRNSHFEGDPIPSMYFNPTQNDAQFPNSGGMSGEQFVPEGVGVMPPGEAAPDAESGPLGYRNWGSASRGIQNVPVMSTVGVQYAADGSGGNIPYQHPGASSSYGAGIGGQSVPVGQLSITDGGQPLVVTGASCPLCGRTNYHTHSEVTLLPSGSATTNHIGSGGAFLSNPGRPVGHYAPGNADYFYQPSTLPSAVAGSNGQVPLSTRLISGNVPVRNSKVRYFVTEYGGDDDEDRIRFYELDRRKKSFENRLARNDAEDEGDDYDDDDDLDWSLAEILMRARSLKRLSEEMRTSFHEAPLVAL